MNKDKVKNLEQLTKNLELVSLSPDKLPGGVKVGQEVLTYKGVVYKVGQVVYTNVDINLGSRGGKIPKRSLGVVIGPCTDDVGSSDKLQMVHVAFKKNISSNIYCDTISLWGKESSNNVKRKSSRESIITPPIPLTEEERREEEEELLYGNITTAKERAAMAEIRRRQNGDDDGFFDTMDEDWEGGRIKRVNQIRSKKSKKKINRKYKKTYKKKGGARKNRKNKTQRKKQSAGSRKNRKGKNIRKKQSAGSRKNRKSKNIRRKQSGGQGLTQEEKKGYEEAFNLLDEDKNGYLSFQEFKPFAKGFGMTDDQAEQEFERLAKKETAGISLEAFLEEFRANKQEMTSEQEMENVFNIIDKDKNGYISPQEFKRAVEEFMPDVSDKLNLLLENNKKDVNCTNNTDDNCKISIQEFKQMIGNLLRMN